MVFQKRDLAGPQTLGQRLRQLRQESGWSIETIAAELKIATKYVQAIEDGRYDLLPGQVYARIFVRLYARRMELDEAAVMSRFAEEYQVVTAAKPSGRPLLVPRAKTDPPWWRRYRRFMVAGVVIGGVLIYFSWQVWRLYSPPRLVVNEPPADVATTEGSVVVRGQTEPGAEVTINRQPVEVTSNGQFSESVEIQRGLNTLRIAAKKPRSGERVVIRQVLFEQR